MTVAADLPMALGVYAALLDLVVVKATLLVVAAVLACRLLRRQSASVRHGIWAVTFAGLLVLPALRLAAPEPKVTVVDVRATATALMAPDHGYEAPRHAEGLAANIGEAASLRGAARLRGAAYRPNRLGANPNGSPPPGPGGADPARFPLWVVVAWSVGFVFQLGRFGVDLRAVAVVRSRAAPCSDRVRRRTERAALDVGLRGAPLTIVSRDVGIPSTFGVMHPTIVLPEAVENWPDDQLDAALLHELVHLRRHDYVTHMITVFVKAAYWMNPLVWYAGRRLIVERERACDDGVILDRIDPISYAQCLMTLATNARSPGACQAVSFAGRSSLSERVGSLLDRTQLRRPLDAWSRLTLVGAAALLIVPATAIEVAGLAQPPRSQDLVAAPSDPDPLVRRHAAWVMGESEDPAHVEPLVEHLTDPDARVRSAAAWALGEIKDSRAIEPLAALLRDDVAGVREMAVLAIGEIEDAAGLAAVRQAASAGVSIEAREWAEAQIRHRDGYPEVFAGELFHPAARRSDLAGYLDDLTAPDARTRALSAQRLGILGAVEAVDPLLDALEDDDAAVRASAVWALDEINPSRRTHTAH